MGCVYHTVSCQDPPTGLFKLAPQGVCVSNFQKNQYVRVPKTLFCCFNEGRRAVMDIIMSVIFMSLSRILRAQSISFYCTIISTLYFYFQTCLFLFQVIQFYQHFCYLRFYSWLRFAFFFITLFVRSLSVYFHIVSEHF